jgi:RecB family exonuclease
MSAAVSTRVFRNVHLSVSRLKKYETCPRSFYLKYVDKGPEEPSGEPAMFGVVLHLTLELLYSWVVEEEHQGRIPEEKLVQFYREAWTSSETKLADVALYSEGLAILRNYLQVHPEANAYNILGIEKEFNEDFGGFLMNGYIDRIDKVGDDHVEIVDFKSNRMLYTREELDSDLQMTTYGLVARRLFPWAKKFSFSFHMLRHNLTQRTERTAQQIDDVVGYVVALGKRSESDTTWEAKLNSNCQYCEGRKRCDVYQKAISDKHDFARVATLDGVDGIAREYERCSKIAKANYARARELEGLLRTKLGEADTLTAAGRVYRLSVSMNTNYDPIRLLDAFERAGVPKERTIRSVMDVGVGKVDAFYTSVAKDLANEEKKKDALLLRARIDATDSKVPGAVKMISSEVKK